MNHQVVDALSRIPTAAEDNTELEDKMSFMVIARRKNHDQPDSVVPSRAKKKKHIPNNLDEFDVMLLTLPELIIARSRDVFCEH